MKDNELDDLIRSLRAESPRPDQVRRWQAAVTFRPKSRWLELAAAVLVGVLIGATLFHQRLPSPTAEIASDDATSELVITKN